jgi:hypothetical protein
MSRTGIRSNPNTNRGLVFGESLYSGDLKYRTSAVFQWSFSAGRWHLNTRWLENQTECTGQHGLLPFCLNGLSQLDPWFEWPFKFQTGNQMAEDHLDKYSGIQTIRLLVYRSSICLETKWFRYLNVRFSDPHFINVFWMVQNSNAWDRNPDNSSFPILASFNFHALI